MGHEANAKAIAKQLRRAIGPEAADLVTVIDVRSRISAGILRRGFFGRLKWLILGR